MDGGDLKLSQVAEGISTLLSRVTDELRTDISLYDITRTGSPSNYLEISFWGYKKCLTDGCPENITTVAFNSTDLELSWLELPYGGQAEISCPCDTASLPLSATRRCAGSAGGVVEWAEPDDSQCRFSDVTRILCTLPDVSKWFSYRLYCSWLQGWLYSVL